MAKKLNNMLKFNEYDKFEKLDGKTKRTEIGGDVLKEHHRTTRSGQLAYIVDNLDDVSDDLVTIIYDMMENELL